VSLRTSAAYIGTRLAAGALAMLTLTLIVRGLGPASYGQYTLAMAAAAIVTQILFNPLNGTLARFYGEADIREPLLVLLRRLLLGIGLFLILLAAILDACGLAVMHGHVLLLAACMALAQGFFDFSGQYLAAAQNSRRYSLMFLAKACLACALAWLAMHCGGGAAAVLGAMSLAFLVAVLLAGTLPMWFARSTADVRSQWSVVRSFAGPLMFTSLLSYVLAWGDRYLLQHLVSLEELGRYSAVSDLAQQTLGLVFSGLCMAWYPRMVMAWGQKDFPGVQHLYSAYASLGLAVVLPAGVGCALILPDVVPKLYGAAYAGVSPWMLAFVALAAIASAVKLYYFDLPLLLGKRVWRHSATIAGAALASLGMAWLAIPHYGITGAAAGVLLGQGCGILLSIACARGVLRPWLPFASVWPPLLATVLMAVLLTVWPVQSWAGIVLKVTGGALVYVAVLVFADFDGVRTVRLRRLL